MQHVSETLAVVLSSGVPRKESLLKVCVKLRNQLMKVLDGWLLELKGFPEVQPTKANPHDGLSSHPISPHLTPLPFHFHFRFASQSWCTRMLRHSLCHQ